MTTSPDDLLASATAAARAAADTGLDDGAATRLRLRTSLASRARPRSRRRLTLIAAVFGTFIGSTAFALAVQSGWTPPWRSSPAPIEAPPPPAPATSLATIAPPRGHVARDTPADPPPTPTAIDAEPLADTTPPPGSSVRPAAASSRIAAAPTAAAPTPTVPSTARPAPPPSPAPTASPASMTPPSSTSPGASRVATSGSPPTANDVSAGSAISGGSTIDDELAAYRIAHTAHFRGGDPAAALAAWDRYLARFPNGSLAPEARYDRALVLVKLQRWAEARAALRPFAATAGGYRQREATELLAALANR